MHPRNLHKNGYNFDALVKSLPALSKFVIHNPVGRQSIDFADPNGVKTLNAALLKHHYDIDLWDIPQGYLCPPVPGRADYIHALADLLTKHDFLSKRDSSPRGDESLPINGLDIGTGANLIYPIIASQSYGWTMIGTDIDAVAIKSAQLIQSNNVVLNNLVKIRHQKNTNKIFDGVIMPCDKFTFSMCNPPFHSSKKAAAMGSLQKSANLKRNQSQRNPNKRLQKGLHVNALNTTTLNFAGQGNELWCNGGEIGFIERMMAESIDYKTQVEWFTSLVSKKDSLQALNKKLKEIGVKDSTTVNMGQGSKVSRFIAWRF